MASNFFGQLFRITTFGESHGPGIGVVIDGCPAGLPITVEEIAQELQLRRPGRNEFTTPRKEEDVPEILSGVFEGKTTGAPIAILIRNQDADSAPYDAAKQVLKPGHAHYTYLAKYGIFDHRGGGRASGRETAARVAAGAIAKKYLSSHGIFCTAYIDEIGAIKAIAPNILTLRMQTLASPLFCPDPIAEKKMMAAIIKAKEEGDSLGGIVACTATIPKGLGDPIYAKLEAMLASAMLSIPASKGFEIGSGFQAARMKGSEHNDPFEVDENGNVFPETNFAGGTLGGISTGAPLYFRVAFKPTSSIRSAQKSATIAGEKTTFQTPQTGRHDPCLAIRAVPVVEAMAALVIIDAFLMNQSS